MYQRCGFKPAGAEQKFVSSKSISNTWVECSNHYTKIFNTAWHPSGFREVDTLYVCHMLEMITDTSNTSNNGRKYWRNNIFTPTGLLLPEAIYFKVLIDQSGQIFSLLTRIPTEGSWNMWHFYKKKIVYIWRFFTIKLKYHSNQQDNIHSTS